MKNDKKDRVDSVPVNSYFVEKDGKLIFKGNKKVLDRYVNFYTDFAFKKLFGSEINKELPISFLNALFEGKEKIIDITYLNSEQLGAQQYDRRGIYDIYCKNDKGEFFIVEMQRKAQDFFKDRCIFYSTFPIRDQASKGYWDYNLKAVYMLSFLEFNLPDYKGDTEYRHDILLMDKNKKTVFYDKLTFVFLEMSKFKKEESELKTLFDKWMFAIKNLQALDDRPKALQEQIFERFFEAAEIARYDKAERFAYQESLKNYWDWYSITKTAKKEGHAQGLAEGRAEGRVEGRAEGRVEGRAEGRMEGVKAVAKALLKQNVDLKIIIETTGLNESDLEDIRSNS